MSRVAAWAYADVFSHSFHRQGLSRGGLTDGHWGVIAESRTAHVFEAAALKQPLKARTAWGDKVMYSALPLPAPRGGGRFPLPRHGNMTQCTILAINGINSMLSLDKKLVNIKWHQGGHNGNFSNAILWQIFFQSNFCAETLRLETYPVLPPQQLQREVRRSCSDNALLSQNITSLFNQSTVALNAEQSHHIA